MCYFFVLTGHGARGTRRDSHNHLVLASAEFGSGVERHGERFVHVCERPLGAPPNQHGVPKRARGDGAQVAVLDREQIHQLGPILACRVKPGTHPTA
eukprot:1191650-Prorocentrum_minimum.AAC.3